MQNCAQKIFSNKFSFYQCNIFCKAVLQEVSFQLVFYSDRKSLFSWLIRTNWKIHDDGAVPLWYEMKIRWITEYQKSELFFYIQINPWEKSKRALWVFACEFFWSAPGFFNRMNMLGKKESKKMMIVWTKKKFEKRKGYIERCVPPSYFITKEKD